MRLSRLPFTMWLYGGIGAVLIIWSGVKIVLLPRRRW
jgi:hypothetical protein